LRFWITKNSELPVHEQLVRQVMLAILSEDLPAGQKLPSIRALARRCGVHSNTVSAAYHELVNRGWLELRPGSGIFVRPLHLGGATGPGAEAFELDVLLTEFLRTVRGQGYEPEEVLHRLEQLVLPRDYTRIAVIEPDPGMREILQAELAQYLLVPVDAIDPSQLPGILQDVTRSGACLVAALPTRVVMLRERLPRSIPLMTLRLRSVVGSLQEQAKPTPDTIISIVSGSADFRRWARAMLIAVGLDPDCLCDVDTATEDWRQRAGAGSLVIADVVAAPGLREGCPAKVFRVVADSCLAEIQRLCRRT
jgi:DNA-binding transcriptional regulator YhcF (GntR family)